MEVLSEQEVSSQEARHIMERRKKENSDLHYEQKICADFLEKLSKLTESQVADLKSELSKLTILKPRHYALIISILPDTEEEVESLFSKERTNLKKDEVKTIVDIVKKFKK
jgi:DNA-directed RNA polymerase subunit F